jgi:hypothetical protein
MSVQNNEILNVFGGVKSRGRYAEGGATRFDKLNVEVRPKKGQCVLFFPGTKASQPDARTLHTACEAVPGHEKVGLALFTHVIYSRYFAVKTPIDDS